MSKDLWTLDDFEGLLESGLASGDERDPLERLGRQIAGQYLDAIVPFCTQVFQGPPGPGAVLAAQEASQALGVLAQSTGDKAIGGLLERLDGLTARAETARGSAATTFEVERRKDIARRLVTDADQASDLVRQARSRSSVPVDAEVVEALAQAVERLQAALRHLESGRSAS